MRDNSLLGHGDMASFRINPPGPFSCSPKVEYICRQATAPLYIQLIYNHKPVYFKSSYFDQLGNPKYAIQSILGQHPPVISQVIGLEEELLEYLSKNQTGIVDIDALKADYYLLSRDLLFYLEEGFQRFMTTFLHDEWRIRMT
ncbi:hypothetical protein [Dyadobacter sp. CY312]|uniref:hypothetical protein n=1 Tax=Dyadobacter sp. CY312 TaxID=2907303 RepID=UPI001F283949|nr:hypothetical protein [Dyadobacter sp. CY312]MCE7041375.1 hypothetical protein [Dyadobacter sp. CY312]